ncbi:MAG: hypothetical protein EXR60_03900 [Dehalococcoidia bacterium]|nr:hypothetical protein [Dehalococcoidia bacterium]
MCCGQTFTPEGIRRCQEVIDEMAERLEADHQALVGFKGRVADLQHSLGVDIPPMTAHATLWEMELAGRERRLAGFRGWLKEHV